MGIKNRFKLQAWDGEAVSRGKEQRADGLGEGGDRRVAVGSNTFASD